MAEGRNARVHARRWTAASVALLVAGLLSLTLVPGARAAGLWWNGQWAYRVGVTVGASGVARTDKPVDVTFDYQALIGSLGGPGTFDPQSVRVLEVDGSGNAFGQPLPAQYDAVTGDTTFIMTGATGAGTTRSFHIYFATTAAGISSQGTTALVSVTDTTDAGQDAYKVSTQAGDWYYQHGGGAFSSLLDRDGHDWISYNSGTGAGGEFRGIPNFPNPLGYFHPGFDLSNSHLVSAGPLRAIVESSSNNGAWSYRSVFYPTYVTSTVTKADPAKAYWWLYEGTPGGHEHFTELSNDILVRSDGTQSSLTAASQGELAGEEWAYFGVPSQNRSLFMAQHDDDGFPDDYFALYGEPTGSMTVWGFGRRGSGESGDYLHGSHTFTMGLMDTVSYDAGAAVVRNAYRSLAVQIGSAEVQGSTPIGTVAGGPPTVTTELPSVIPAGGYVSLPSPVRLYDSRDPGAGGPLQFGSPRTLAVTGSGRAANDATAAVLNVTAVGADTGGFLTVWPGGTQPTVSNVNYRAGETVPNLVTVALSGQGTVMVADGAGATHVVVDLFGYYAPSIAGGGYHPVNPTRVLDTRNGGGPVAAGSSRTASVNNVAGLVAGHATAVAFNMTVDGATQASYLAAYPGNGSVPATSNLNFGAGQTVPNAVISGVSPTGDVAIYNAVGNVHVVVDVVGWFDDGSGAAAGGLRFHPIAPARLLDTRPAAGLANGVTRDTMVVGVGGVPDAAKAVAMNVTVTEAAGDSYLTVWPSGEAQPTASTQNMVTGTTRANAALAKLGAGGAVSAVSVGAGTHLLYDVGGYFA